MAGQIPQPSGKVSSSNPLLKPHMSRTWGVGLDIDRCIIVAQMKPSCKINMSRVISAFLKYTYLCYSVILCVHAPVR